MPAKDFDHLLSGHLTHEPEREDLIHLETDVWSRIHARKRKSDSYKNATFRYGAVVLTVFAIFLGTHISYQGGGYGDPLGLDVFMRAQPMLVTAYR